MTNSEITIRFNELKAEIDHVLEWPKTRPYKERLQDYIDNQAVDRNLCFVPQLDYILEKLQEVMSNTQSEMDRIALLRSLVREQRELITIKANKESNK